MIPEVPSNRESTLSPATQRFIMRFSDNQAFRQGLTAYEDGNYQQAIDHLRCALETDEADWNAKFLLAMSLALQQQNTDAALLFSEIRRRCPVTNLQTRAGVMLSVLMQFSH